MAIQKVTLQVRVKPSTADKLKSIADSREETLSEYVRKLLENHLLMQ